MVNQKYLDKAEVLIEALPYIQKFNRKIIVVKYGGSAMSNEELKANVIKDAVLLKLVGFKPIIVHGGGKEISKWVGKVGMEAKFINGLRVTDSQTMEIAEMVLAKVNKELVSHVESLGVQAVGISGKDGGLLKCKKKYSNGEDIGFVGDITEVNPKILYDLLEKDFLPIICPVGMDAEYKAELGKILKKLQQHGMTIFMISHDVEFVAEYADRVGLFFEGSIITSKETRAFFAGNNFYTTAANRMARQFFPDAVTGKDVVSCLKKLS